MNGIATITQRGQVVIPQPIREYFGLKASDKLFFEVEKGRIVAKPILSLEQAFGIIKTKKIFSKKSSWEIPGYVVYLGWLNISGDIFLRIK